MGEVKLNRRTMQETLEEQGYCPTMELRIFGVGAVLQQKWNKPKTNNFGHVSGYDEFWLNVQHVYGETSKT